MLNPDPGDTLLDYIMDIDWSPATSQPCNITTYGDGGHNYVHLQMWLLQTLLDTRLVTAVEKLSRNTTFVSLVSIICMMVRGRVDSRYDHQQWWRNKLNPWFENMEHDWARAGSSSGDVSLNTQWWLPFHLTKLQCTLSCCQDRASSLKTFTQPLLSQKLDMRISKAKIFGNYIKSV